MWGNMWMQRVAERCCPDKVCQPHTYASPSLGWTLKQHHLEQGYWLGRWGILCLPTYSRVSEAFTWHKVALTGCCAPCRALCKEHCMEHGRWHRGRGPSSLPPCLQPSAGTARRCPTFLVSHLSFPMLLCYSSEDCCCMELPGPQPPYLWAAVGTCRDVCCPLAARVCLPEAPALSYSRRSGGCLCLVS